MKLSELIKFIGISPPEGLQAYLNEELDDRIASFIRLFWAKEDISSQRIRAFQEAQQELSPLFKNVIYGLIGEKSAALYKEVEPQIQQIRQLLRDGRESEIDASLIESIPAKNFLLFYCLFRDAPELSLSHSISREIPWVLNMLSVLGGLDGINVAPLQVDLTKPFRTIGARAPEEKISPPKKPGIKDTDRFFPFGQSGKTSVDVPDTVVLAYDKKKKKIMYIRTERAELAAPSSVGILASKIARRVSRQHFSSERLLTDRAVASRALPGYKIALPPPPPTSPLDREEVDHKEVDGKGEGLYKKLRNRKAILPGLGIIDEVCNYIGNEDPNMENIGISDDDLSKAYFTKIDFDRSTLTRSIRRFTVQLTVVNKTKELKQIDENEQVIEQHDFGSSGYFRDVIYGRDYPDKKYELERLRTGLKLAFFTKELIDIDVQKSYLHANDEDKEALDKALPFLEKTNEKLLERIAESQEEYQALIKDNQIQLEKILREVMMDFVRHDSKHLTRERSEKILEGLYKKSHNVLELIYPNKGIKYLMLERKLKQQNREALRLLIRQDLDLIQPALESKAILRSPSPQRARSPSPPQPASSSSALSMPSTTLSRQVAAVFAGLGTLATVAAISVAVLTALNIWNPIGWLGLACIAGGGVFVTTLSAASTKNRYLDSLAGGTFGLSVGTAGVLSILGAVALSNIWNPLGMTLTVLGGLFLLGSAMNAAMGPYKTPKKSQIAPAPEQTAEVRRDEQQAESRETVKRSQGADLHKRFGVQEKATQTAERLSPPTSPNSSPSPLSSPSPTDSPVSRGSTSSDESVRDQEVHRSHRRGQ